MTSELIEPNRILGALTEQQRDRLDRYGEDVALCVGTTLLEAQHAIDHIYFVRSGLLSLLVVLPDNRIADAGFIDQEGAIGLAYDVAQPVSFTRVSVSANGRALRLPPRLLRELQTGVRGIEKRGR